MLILNVVTSIPARSAADLLGQKWKDAMRTLQLAAPEMSEGMLKVASAVGVTNLRQ